MRWGDVLVENIKEYSDAAVSLNLCKAGKVKAQEVWLKASWFKRLYGTVGDAKLEKRVFLKLFINLLHGPVETFFVQIFCFLLRTSTVKKKWI